MGERKKYSIHEHIPTQCTDFVKHKWSSSDKIDAVAKRYGIKDPKRIWEVNGKLAKSRRKGGNFKAGDVVNIPFSDAGQKRWTETAKKYNRTKKVYEDLTDLLQDQIKDINAKIKKLDDQITIIVRRKYDARKERVVVKGLADASSVLAVALKGMPMTSSPIASFAVKPVVEASKVLNYHKKWMAGGTVDEKELKRLENEIGKLKDKISKLEREIADKDKHLAELGTKTIQALCSEKTMTLWAGKQLKLFGK